LKSQLGGWAYRIVCLGGLALSSLGWATTAGGVGGTVRDPSDKVVCGAEVTVREENTGLTYSTHTDQSGHYALPVLPVGRYDLEVAAGGFRKYQHNNIVLDTNAALALDLRLEVGSVAQTVSVLDNALHIETESTQLGEVIAGRQMSAVPLDGRSYTDLLSLQAGVAPSTTVSSSTVQDIGATILNPSGTLNPGTISVNGQREYANFFSVNGSDVEEDVNAGTAIIPNLDSIAEFRMVTGNFDAEYGEFSGGQISVITKAGGNSFHGNAFEFLRTTALDARNYFSPTRGTFRQDQFGGTLGGPLRPDKAFFFADYQGTRQTQGVDTGTIGVPSDADRTGDLTDLASNLTGTVSGPYLASLLTQKLGRPITLGEPYFTAGCTAANCVFPHATIPQGAWSLPAQRLLQYIPARNGAEGFATSAYNQIVRDDKGALRLDGNTGFGLLTAYYFIDDFNLNDPYPVANGGANVPGFNALTLGRAQLISLGDTKTFGAHAVDEFHVSYLRDANNLGQPLGGLGVSLASQGFVNANGKDSIVPLNPAGEGVESLSFNAYSTGTAPNELRQTNNTYQVVNTFTRAIGTHTLKLGGAFHADEVNAHPVAQYNGTFNFAGTETGLDFADFLIGVPSQYNQSQLNPFYGRNRYIGLFAQDSWKALPSLTLNYGLRWDRVAPWSEKYNQISTFDAGVQSVVFPGAPAGILYPGDLLPNGKTVPKTLAPIGDRNFAPRVGLAWTPRKGSSSAMEKLMGADGATSIRASYGVFYTAIDATSIGVLAANPPYGNTYTSPVEPLFQTPFTNATNGQSNGQPFPYTFAPLNSSRKHPDANFDWSGYLPIDGIPGYSLANRAPYTEEWMLSIERQAGPNTVFDATYVGNASHRQRVLIAANPGNPQLCLSLSQTSEVLPGTTPCGPNGENATYFPAGGGEVDGTRGPLGGKFGVNALQSNIGHANYNALEVGARHTTGDLEFSASYTYSKSLDESSNPGEEVNPFHPELSYGLSSFDVRQNFVVSYEYQLPLARYLQHGSITNGWSLAGIAHVSSGFPVTMIDNGDNSLIGTNPNGVNNSSIDEPDYDGGPLQLNRNPRAAGHPYFAPGEFSMNALGTPGTAKRRFFHGPGGQDYDMALARRVQLGESRAALFRLEGFNVFNHTAFNTPGSVDGNIGDSTFGDVVAAAPARILQAAVKFNF